MENVKKEVIFAFGCSNFLIQRVDSALSPQ